jgi:hypothetical protein
VILGPSLNRDETLRAWGSRYTRIVVNRCQGNKRQACRVLGISYHTLQAYLRYPADVLRPAESGAADALEVLVAEGIPEQARDEEGVDEAEEETAAL